jgi:hypothetical protein
MTDPTEAVRVLIANAINGNPRTREQLKTDFGQVWDTNELQKNFEVIGFAAPVVAVKRRSDGVVGSLFFQNSPRFYWGFEPHKEE